MINISLTDLAADIAAVIDNLGGRKVVVINHTFDTFLAKVTSVLNPEKIPAIVVAAPGGIDLPAGIAQLPFVAGNTSLPLYGRLEALQSAFFLPGHDAHVWLDGWYPDVLPMEHAAVEKYGSLEEYWAGGDNTQVLELIPAEVSFQPSNQWNVDSTT
ncbi:hypothetical protein PENCOP_c004G04712 [Penicillium coprophilum]|uniref:AB hydrolase-1 domain-containing protein n=1 Tax=Penicillium coprophilum TaxID=36646 RepID=A0A1V6UVH1_9EURO|nr:hypothetical protein PENCOP_c004G04712 [Penicillium coprophilum]